MRQFLKSITRTGLAVLSRTAAGTSFYERLYETSPHRLADLIVRLQTRPKFDLIWTTRLMNGGKIHIQVRADNPRSWEFAHAYHWHDVDIRDLEYALLRRFAADRIEPIFLDIGANMGLRSLLPLSVGLHCILFEPNQELRDFTTSLFALNDFHGFELHNVCLSDYSGTATFYISTNSYMSSLDRDWLAADGAAREIEVSVTSLDDWISTRPDLWQRPSLIKIDVEGAEFRVLEGARGYIGRQRPPIICEIAMNSGNRERIWDFCKSMKYRIHSIRNTSTQLVRAIDRPNFIGFSNESNFLLAPEECAFLELARRHPGWLGRP